MSIVELMKLLKAYDDVDSTRIASQIELTLTSALKLKGTENSNLDTQGLVYQTFQPALEKALEDYKVNLKEKVKEALKEFLESLEDKEIKEKVVYNKRLSRSEDP